MTGRRSDSILDIRLYAFSFGLLVALSGLTGCMKEHGPRRLSVTGTVTYQGKEVPGGLVIFEPDSSRGNSGPGGVAEIVNGKFATRKEFGVVSGPLVARIIGWEKQQNAGEPEPDPLFNEYHVPVDISGDEAVTLDFDVPARAKN